jgi:hypothetical protein
LVIRAVIVNSAFPNINDNSNISTTGQLYNNSRGYGRIDALSACQMLSSPRLTPGSFTSSCAGWAYDTIAVINNKNLLLGDSYNVHLSAKQRLLVTLTWNRKITKLSSLSYRPEPLANLKLTITNQSGTVTYFNEQDNKNNLRRCDVIVPEDGYYTITVSSPEVTQASYGLAFRIVPQLPCDFDIDYFVNARDLDIMIENWLVTGIQSPGDLVTPFGKIDFADFGAFAPYWLTYNKAYHQP